MQCLNCGTEMITNQVTTKKDQISYDMCGKCGSLWLDAGMLDKMAFQVQGSIEFCEQEKDPEPEAHPKKCPRCDDSTLSKVKFLESDDIQLHYCRNCGGFWLDGGELNLIDKELADIMPVSGHGFSDFVNNIHVTYWYKRVQKKSSETDFQVEVEPIEGSKREASTDDKCPACGAALNVYRLGPLRYEGCPKCKGIWLRKDELREMKNKVGGSALRWMNDEIENVEKAGAISADRFCVHCKTVKMVSVIFGKTKVVIDWCPKCHGEWLDRGEFQAIVDYLKDEMVKLHHKEIEKQVAVDLEEVVKGGPESRLSELLDAKAAFAAMINSFILEHSNFAGMSDKASNRSTHA